jgi:hypothetical protein
MWACPPRPGTERTLKMPASYHLPADETPATVSRVTIRTPAARPGAIPRTAGAHRRGSRSTRSSPRAQGTPLAQIGVEGTHIAPVASVLVAENAQQTALLVIGPDHHVDAVHADEDQIVRGGPAGQ